MPTESDVLIVGGGVAGLAAAARLGAAGRRVCVVDRAPLPRDKVCGEGLMPMGLAALETLGLDTAALPGAPFRGLECHSRGIVARMDFPAPAPGGPAEAGQGRGVRRTALIEALHALASRHPGVVHRQDDAREPVWEGGRIVGVRGRRATYRAPVVLAADGVQSGLAQRAGLAAHPYGERMALRRHYRLAEGAPMPRVLVGLFAPHDVYLTPVGEGVLLATTMTDRAGYRAVASRYDAFLRRSPCGALFAGAEPVSPQRGWHHPLFAPPRYTVGGMLVVGDAGGGVDPCLGMGMSMALASALYAAEAAGGMLEEPARRSLWAAHFDRRRRILFRHLYGFGRVFRFMVRSPRGSALLVGAMRHWPGVAESLLEIVAAGRPWRSFAWPALLQPLWAESRTGMQGGA